MSLDLDAIWQSYDTVAEDYADLLRGELSTRPVDRAVLGLFSELARVLRPGAQLLG